MPTNANHKDALKTRDITTATNVNLSPNKWEFNPTLSAIVLISRENTTSCRRSNDTPGKNLEEAFHSWLR